MPILHEIIHFHIGYYMSSVHKRNVVRHKILGKIGDISYIFELHNTFETSLSTIEHRSYWPQAPIGAIVIQTQINIINIFYLSKGPSAQGRAQQPPDAFNYRF